MKCKALLLCATSILMAACNPEIKSSTVFGWNPEQLRNGATIEQHADYKVLNLGSNDGYYDFENIGNKISQLKDFSISVYFNVDSANTLDGYGHFLFAFSKLAENQADEGPYVAMRLNELRFETSTGGWNHEEFVMQGGKPERNVWIHALFRQSGKTGELYLDGKLIGRNENMPIIAEIFDEAPTCCWIGKAPFKGDKYLCNTQIAGFSLYDYAISDKELEKLVASKPQVEL